MKCKPSASVDFYRYLEQDERVLAEIAKSEEARQAHLHIAEQYRELAAAADVDHTTPDVKCRDPR